MDENEDINETLRNETADQLENIAKNLRVGRKNWIRSVSIDDISIGMDGTRTSRKSLTGIDYNGENFSISFDVHFEELRKHNK